MNHRKVLNVLHTFAIGLNTNLAKIMNEDFMLQARGHEGLQPAISTLRRNLVGKSSQFTVELTLEKDPTAAIKVLAGVAVVGLDGKSVGHATLHLHYWTHLETLALEHFSVLGVEADGFPAMKNPHIALAFDTKNDRRVFSLEIEALNAEAWKNVHDTLEEMYSTPMYHPFDPVGVAALEKLSAISPRL